MNQDELNNIIEKHQHWVYEDCEGWGHMKADLEGDNLMGNICWLLNIWKRWLN